MFATFVTGAIAMGIIFLYGCTGEILTEKAGHLNLGIPGIMCVGAYGGCLGVSIYLKHTADVATMSGVGLILVAILFCILFS